MFNASLWIVIIKSAMIFAIYILADVRCLWIVIKIMIIKLLLINGVYILTGRSEYFSMDIEIIIWTRLKGKPVHILRGSSGTSPSLFSRSLRGVNIFHG